MNEKDLLQVTTALLAADVSRRLDSYQYPRYGNPANPELLAKTGECKVEEGCLSVPGIYETVTRASNLRVRALGLDGLPFELDADGLLAVCIQHEMDHLVGKMFVDYLSPMKRARLAAKQRKKQRLAG